MVTRFLDYLDESAAGVIRVAYLLAGVIAVASYFADGSQHIPLWIANTLVAVLPWTLAGALEIHTYLTARRVRRAYQDRQAAAQGSDEYEHAEKALTLNLWILAGLLAFSMYNQLQYLAQTWTPPETPLTPPGPWAYLIRAVVTPAAFMAAAFLAPVGEGMASRVQQEASYLTRAAFKAAARQWKGNLRSMQQHGHDITAALVHLVDDPKEKRVIGTIWQAMHPGETPPTPHAAMTVPALPAPPPLPEPTPPPVEPKGPKARPRRDDGATLTLVGSAVRTPRGSADALASYETAAREAFAAGATSIEKMRAATGMSKTAAASWVRALKESAVRTPRKAGTTKRAKTIIEGEGVA